jgi:NADP-dependent aldehyde dehydrogenase
VITGYNCIGYKKSAKGKDTFRTFNPVLDEENKSVFYEATFEELDEALVLASKAFETFRFLKSESKISFFQHIENLLGQNKQEILSIYREESGLSISRAESEFKRTLLQIQQHAQLIASYEWMSPSIDTAITENDLLKSDIRKVNIGIGPVIVFGASNFPLAYSTIGGDSIAALAAGCPVIVKSHPMHAGTSEKIAQLVVEAAKISNLPEGVFSHVNGVSNKIGAYLVEHPLAKAVAFTGSFEGGMSIFRLASMRKEPIPVFAEMGSINPVVVHGNSLKKNRGSWASSLAESITNDGGQFCTKPGVVFVEKDDCSFDFINELSQLVKAKGSRILIHPNLKVKLVNRLNELGFIGDTNLIKEDSKCAVHPVIIELKPDDFLMNSQFLEEFFGPVSIIVHCENQNDILRCLHALNGQLTGSIFIDHSDIEASKVRDWIEVFELKVGRINFNNVPTGVRVCHSMQHGGPFPASTDLRFGAVGADSIQRFLRPICYQNFPDSFLPEILKDANPLNANRRINGYFSFAEIIR